MPRPRNHRLRSRLALGAAATLAALLATTPATGHVMPSVDENNRYLKLGLLGDRIRLVYTVYIGERPGAMARRLLDRNKNRILDTEEGDAYGKEMAEQVSGGLSLEVDGAAYPVTWKQISVGFGTPTVNAGAFSVDLVAWICLADPAQRRRHTLVLHDGFRLPRPGETEIYVDESPGVTVTRSALGSDKKSTQLKISWRGATGFLRDLGFYLDFEVAPDVKLNPDASCGDDTPRASGPSATHRGWVAVVLVGLLGLVGVALWLRRRSAHS